MLHVPHVLILVLLGSMYFVIESLKGPMIMVIWVFPN